MSENKFDFNDLLIKPKVVSYISSRKSINPFKDGFLPLITAPMDTVVSSKNIKEFIDNKIVPCLPRGEQTTQGFTALSLQDFVEFFATKGQGVVLVEPRKILIDIANGHMHDVMVATRMSKEIHGDKLILMVGNVANPSTYVGLSNAGADYVRVGIGNGGGCLTTQNTGVGYPMASLIQECYELSCGLEKPAYIVADGGMKDYSDIIKALALGADFVMLGNILNKSLESAGDNYIFKMLKVSQSTAKIAHKLGIPVYKKFRGMSTKEVQRKWGALEIKTSEGVIRYRKVEYTLKQWVENFEHYLRSAMSYSGAISLTEFINQSEVIQITDNAYKRFNK